MEKQEFIEELSKYPDTFVVLAKPLMKEEYYEICLASFSDYDNSCEIERANQQYLVKEYPEFISIHYGLYFSQICAIEQSKIDCLDWESDDIQEKANELIEILNSLTEYPSIDDILSSQVALELQNDMWENTISRDFKNDLSKRFQKFDFDDKECDESILRTTFEKKREQLNLNWEIQSGGNAWIPFRKIAEAFTEKDIDICFK